MDPFDFRALRARWGMPRVGLLCWLCLAHPAALSASESPAAPAAPDAHEQTLSELLSFAEQHSYRTRIAALTRGHGAAARAEAAAILPENPELMLAAGPRFLRADQRELDFQMALAQPIDIAGQRALRIAAAARTSERLEAEAQATRWDVRRSVTAAYRAAIVEQERLHIAEQAARFSDETLLVARRRLKAGDISSIDLRVAEADAAQTAEQLLVAEQARRKAELDLCEAAGWPLTRQLRLALGLEPVREVPALPGLLELARQKHPALQALRASTTEAHAQVELADREAWPRPRLGVQFSREGSFGAPPNYILLGTLGVPLPVWQRNQAARANARVDEQVSRLQEQAAAHSLELGLARAHAALVAAARRIALATSMVLPSLDESLTLVRRGFEAGEIPLLDVSDLRERLLDSRRAALEAHADYYVAWSELEAIVGEPLGSSAARSVTGAE
jgi:outer membrane protein, heavy metal efflux system